MKEDNRLIAEFMGIAPIQESPGVYSYADLPWFSVREKTPEKVMDAIVEYVKYDTSWDWLMPVVHKITIDRDFQDQYENNSAFWDAYNTISISDVHRGVVEFIKWYNNENISN